MQNTTAIIESIDNDFLAAVSGGCGGGGGCRRRCCGGGNNIQKTIINNYGTPAEAAPQVAPVGPSVSTNVSVGYQQ
jgi:hypothetical protein